MSRSRTEAARSARRALAASAALVAVAVAFIPTSRNARACGPDFPNRLLQAPDAALLSAPRADFVRELARLGALAPGPFVLNAPEVPQAETLRVEADDLERALTALGAAPAAREAALARLAAARERRDASALAGLEPAEIRLYAEGAIHYARGEVDLARARWLALLELPAAARPRRSVWAAYMLGRSHAPEGQLGCATLGPDAAADAARALRWLAQARELALAGFEDRLGLAATSLGWEAAILHRLGREEEAMAAYLAQAATGDATAAPSLERVASELVARPEQLPSYATSAVLRPVLTARLLAAADAELVPGADGPKADRWLAALEQAGEQAVAGADRFAWLAYRLGRYDVAARWAALAPADAAVALWTRARLALRRGDRAQGAALLAQVIGGFAPDERWSYREPDYDDLGGFGEALRPAHRASGELGLLALSGGEFLRALDLLLATDYRTDAAYVAERVVTIEELRGRVDSQWPAPSPSAGLAERERVAWIRYLLGRRLVRAGRFAEAAAYLPEGPRERLAAYASALARARDPREPREARAWAFWEAAKIARYDGMELMGTEGPPDWQMFSGAFEREPDLEFRTRAVSRVAPPHRSERGRARREGPTPDRRFHYRYVAGDHALEAVKLLPPTAPEAGPMLCNAARWVIFRDPPAARRFLAAFRARSRFIEAIPTFGGTCPPEP